MSYPNLLSIKTATIAATESLSGVVHLAGKAPLRILMPAVWDAANITFQVSEDGVTYYNLHDGSGAEYAVAAGVGRAIILPCVDFAGVNYFKIRSGTAAVPVAQAAGAVINIVVRPL